MFRKLSFVGLRCEQARGLRGSSSMKRQEVESKVQPSAAVSGDLRSEKAR